MKRAHEAVDAAVQTILMDAFPLPETVRREDHGSVQFVLNLAAQMHQAGAVTARRHMPYRVEAIIPDAPAFQHLAPDRPVAAYRIICEIDAAGRIRSHDLNALQVRLGDTLSQYHITMVGGVNGAAPHFDLVVEIWALSHPLHQLIRCAPPTSIARIMSIHSDVTTETLNILEQLMTPAPAEPPSPPADMVRPAKRSRLMPAWFGGDADA
jgi:hypothetical protein